MFEHFVDTSFHRVEKIQRRLYKMLRWASGHGLPDYLTTRLGSSLNEYRDDFSVKLGADRPWTIASMKIRLVPGAVPMRVNTHYFSAY